MKYIKLFENKELYLINAIRINNLNKVKKLIKAGVDVNYQESSNTALMWASSYSNIEIVKELIKAGADWNIQNKLDRDFLYYLKDENKEIIIKEFPEEYELYLLKKETDKYNL